MYSRTAKTKAPPEMRCNLPDHFGLQVTRSGSRAPPLVMIASFPATSLIGSRVYGICTPGHVSSADPALLRVVEWGMGRSASYRSDLPKHRLGLDRPSFFPWARNSATLRLLRACKVTSVTAPASPKVVMIAMELRQNSQAWLIAGSWLC